MQLSSTVDASRTSRIRRPIGTDEPRLAGVPPRLRASAEWSGCGEAFWPAAVAADVASALAKAEVAIVGGEVYGRHGGAWGVYLGQWRTTPSRGEDEPWSRYVGRGLVQAREAIEEERLEREDGLREVVTELLYFFAVQSTRESGW